MALNNIPVAPVPAGNTVTVTNTNISLTGQPTTVWSMEGQLMTRFALQSINTLEIANWPAGIYLLKLPAGETARLVKQ